MGNSVSPKGRETEFRALMHSQTQFGNAYRGCYEENSSGSKLSLEPDKQGNSVSSFTIEMKSKYRFIDADGIYFVTSTVVEWLPVFTTSKYCNIIIDSLKFCQQNQGLKLFAFVILDNHFHLVATAEEFSKVNTSLKKYTARKIIDGLKYDNKNWLLTELAFYKKKYKIKSDYQVWQEGSHPQLIFSDGMLIQKIEYIHNNPVKRGLVDRPEHWRYSSARNYFLDDHSLIQIEKLPI